MQNQEENKDQNPSKEHPEANEEGIEVNDSTPNTPMELVTLVENKKNRRKEAKPNFSELTKVSLAKLKEIGIGPKEDIEISILLLMRLESFCNYQINLEMLLHFPTHHMPRSHPY